MSKCNTCGNEKRLPGFFYGAECAKAYFVPMLKRNLVEAGATHMAAVRNIAEQLAKLHRLGY